MDIPPSPFAPEIYPELPAIGGIRLCTAEAGIKYAGRPDVMLALMPPQTRVAGVFTRSRCPSAPVDWCKARLAGGTARALLVNSGNANAFTGMKGRDAVERSARDTASVAGCAVDEVFLASTGVIGEPLPAERFAAVLEGMAGNADEGRWMDAARAIMTTDTYPKLATAEFSIGDTKGTLNGIAKGSGMIAPDMATMLAFLFTDAPIAAPVLQDLLRRANRKSFNAITVDSDTSTSDTVLLFATGPAPVIDEPADPRLQPFRRALNRVMRDLAQQIVKDGEGAGKFVTITVDGASGNRSAHRIAMAIANSPLVKTAIAGEDANWGRVVMAVGKAGEPADRDKLAIWFGDIRVAVNGERDPDYAESAASQYMANAEIRLRVDLGLGPGTSTVWTCDLTRQYVAINGDYRS